MREGGRILASALQKVSDSVQIGMRLSELDALAANHLTKAGGELAFRGYKGVRGVPPYPATLCASLNDEVVHGIGTRDIVLKGGDIVGLDLGVRYPATTGLYTDMAITVGVGHISDTATNLINVTKESLDQAIRLVKPGQRDNHQNNCTGQRLQPPRQTHCQQYRQPHREKQETV